MLSPPLPGTHTIIVKGKTERAYLRKGMGHSRLLLLRICSEQKKPQPHHKINTFTFQFYFKEFIYLQLNSSILQENRISYYQWSAGNNLHVQCLYLYVGIDERGRKEGEGRGRSWMPCNWQHCITRQTRKKQNLRAFYLFSCDFWYFQTVCLYGPSWPRTSYGAWVGLQLLVFLLLPAQGLGFYAFTTNPEGKKRGLVGRPIIPAS